MQTIKQFSGTVTTVRDLSLTAREYTIALAEPLTFIAGAFLNVFIEHESKTIRRAFSITSSDQDKQNLTFTIRLNPYGELTPLLWEKDFTNTTVRLMGPLGLNTADKMTAKRVFLFGFGVGAGVVKSLADHIAKRPDLEQLTIVTGNRSLEEILYQDYFNTLAQTHSRVSVTYVVSDKNQSLYPVGYIQDHIKSYNFENSDVYMCGQGVACTALKNAIQSKSPQHCNFFVEDFH